MLKSSCMVVVVMTGPSRQVAHKTKQKKQKPEDGFCGKLMKTENLPKTLST